MHIDIAEIANLKKRWSYLANAALGQAPTSQCVFRDLLCDTFRFLSLYDEGATSPKALIPLFIFMSEFAAYSLMSDDRRGFDTIVMSVLTTQLLACFANGFQNSGSAYPILKLPTGFKDDCINMETHDLSDLRYGEECPF